MQSQRHIRARMNICKYCNNEFIPDRNHPKAKSCSKKCSVKLYQQSKGIGVVRERECLNCKGEFKSKYNNKIYCSVSCRRFKYVKDNKELIQNLGKKWRLENKERKNELRRIWKNKNRGMYKKIRRKNVNKRLRIDIEFKVKKNLRSRLSKAIKRNVKYDTTMNLVGCSKERLMKHLESQFDDSMSWYNYGEWHIDHIIPCASFDLSKEEEQRMCFHYTNLQPLWGIDNIIKSNNI